MRENYAQIVVSLPWHEKVLVIPEKDRAAAFGVYCAAVCYCQSNRTDGLIREPELVKVFPSAKLGHLAKLLVECRLFDRTPDGYAVHDYLEWNKSRAEIEADAKARSLLGRAGGIASGRARARAARTADGQPFASPSGQPDGQPFASLDGQPEPQPESNTAIQLDSSTALEGLEGFSPVSEDKGLSLQTWDVISPAVYGVWLEKSRHDASEAELNSLRVLCKSFSDSVLMRAISQVCAQGESPSNFALITHIAKTERSKQ